MLKWLAGLGALIAVFVSPAQAATCGFMAAAMTVAQEVDPAFTGLLTAETPLPEGKTPLSAEFLDGFIVCDAQGTMTSFVLVLDNAAVAEDPNVVTHFARAATATWGVIKRKDVDVDMFDTVYKLIPVVAEAQKGGNPKPLAVSELTDYTDGYRFRVGYGSLNQSAISFFLYVTPKN